MCYDIRTHEALNNVNASINRVADVLDRICTLQISIERSLNKMATLYERDQSLVEVKDGAD